MMWRMIISVLLILWLIGFAIDVAGGLIHLLLIMALGLFFIGLFRGKAAKLQGHARTNSH